MALGSSVLVDIPGNATTTTTVTVGSTTFNVLESGADHDWFRSISRAVRKSLSRLDALGVEPDLDTYLIIRDADGDILYEHDDIHLTVDTELSDQFHGWLHRRLLHRCRLV